VRRPAKKIPNTRQQEIVRLANVLAVHAEAATRRGGKLRSCMCGMCGYAARRLQKLRDGEA